MADLTENPTSSEAQAVASGTPVQDSVPAYDFPVLSEAPDIVSRKDLGIIPEELARTHSMVIFERSGNVIKVAMADPNDIGAQNVLRFITQKEKFSVQIYLAEKPVLEKIMAFYASTEKALTEAVQSLEEVREEDFKVREDASAGGSGGIEEVVQDAPIAKLVQVIIKHAVDGQASDIHIEPTDDNYRVRYRVDGILHSSLFLPKPVGKAVVSRIKILSELKIDEKRKPQDGRFQVDDNGQPIDFRVSTLPVVEGEKVVMRILDKGNRSFELKDLGLWGRNFEVLSERIKDPFGIILISGPTGSGKSTTLYGFLQILNKEERNIITLEDPVEYFLPGINQSQIKPEIGYSFANGLRSILRQDPNVIMVGEIRDAETAELAIHAALTGHLIFSTVHTNDAVGSIPRLVDMGIEAFLLASSLRAVSAQRLVRKICVNCKEEIHVPEAEVARIREQIKNVSAAELQKYNLGSPPEIRFYRGKGCTKCNNLGYKGRISISEVLEVTARVQEIISEGRDNEAALMEEAAKQGMLTMRQDGLLKAMLGITTLEEVERVTENKSEMGGDENDDRG